ncbi:MAG: hypothetical protein IH955_02140, partial [Chloroflexi bacterium]|nr:hypothetical protein [Chloroflexota bacterium]
MAKQSNNDPVMFFTNPLSWLDERELESHEWLMKNFGFEVTAFQNTVDLVTFAIEQIENPDTRHLETLISKLKSGKGLTTQKVQLGTFVSYSLLIQALDCLHASRRLLTCGYFSRMLGSLRTMVEALRASDICRTDTDKALEWFQGKEIKKSTKTDLHPTIKLMMRQYDFLSKIGGHPFLLSAHATGLGKPYHELVKGQQEEYVNAIGPMLEYLSNTAGATLQYVNDVYKIDWESEPERKHKKDIVLGLEPQDKDLDPGQIISKVTMYKSRRDEAQDDTEVDYELLWQLSTLFREPPRMLKVLTAPRAKAIGLFLGEATTELHQMALVGFDRGTKLGLPPIS